MTEGKLGENPDAVPRVEAALVSEDNIEQHKQAIIDLLIECFPQYDFDPDYAESIVTKTMIGPSEVTVLLKDLTSDTVVGFTTAHIFSNQPDTARINITAITPRLRGMKLVGTLVSRLEDELRKRKVTTVTRSSRIKDGYADAIQRHYGDKIIEVKEPTGGDNDPKRGFKIKL